MTMMTVHLSSSLEEVATFLMEEVLPEVVSAEAVLAAEALVAVGNYRRL
jgi:hypothetical protein